MHGINKLKKMNHTLYEVKYTGVCIKGLLTSKKRKIGYYRKVGNTYTETEVIPFTGKEPTKQALFSLINVCQSYLMVDAESIKWKLLDYTAQ